MDWVGPKTKRKKKASYGLTCFFIWAKKFEFGPSQNGQIQVKSTNFNLACHVIEAQNNMGGGI